ncbi:uncharacterized protein LOC106636363 [Copidosoma floridanum]|uniref:uncharacterized protein LOC106636363 n=1 Tax=Copidosoma floridanum TaxID=29053 RepID=UPI000C6F5D2B|nr:uncharacterized protein LOC106636363 [Copidosoma floridanum]
MDRVSASFHKNVLLLTKSVPPNTDFKKHFKENMFDKPNTSGFMHVSYYLLSIYYKDSLKNKVTWPVICKQTESQYRNDVKKCLTTIASEHIDVNFPPILASHLLLAGGTKFILIMWKLSIVILRAYLRQEHESILSNAPKQGPCQELTMRFLINVTTKHKNFISRIRNDRENAEIEAKKFLSEKTQEQNDLKKEILQLMEDLKNIVEAAPANKTAKQKLLNIDNKEIVNLWVKSLVSSSQTIEKYCESLEELDELLKYINNVVSNITGNSQTLNGHAFDKIYTDVLYKLVPPDVQILLYNLYQEDSLNINNFFSIFTVLVKQCAKANLKKKCIQELSSCTEQLKISNGQLQSAMNDFQNLHKEMETFRTNKLTQNRKLKDTQEVLTDAPEYAKVLFMPSPCIQITNNYEAGLTVSQNDLKLTPSENAHRELFGKYAESNKKGIFLTKKKLPCLRIDFEDETFNDTSSFKSLSLPQRFHTPPKKGNKYSRIFSTLRQNYNRVNNSMMTLMSTNSILPAIPKNSCTSMIDSCNSSQEFSREPLLSHPRLNSTTVMEKLEKKVPPKSHKRRSISDLVERYKNLVQKRDMQT